MRDEETKSRRDEVGTPEPATLADYAASVSPPAANNIPEIKPGINTSEFLATAGTSAAGGVFFVALLLLQFVTDQATKIPTAVSVTALIVAGVVTAWPIVLYSTNRRRLKSDEIAACAKLAAGEIEAKARAEARGTNSRPVSGRARVPHANGIATRTLGSRDGDAASINHGQSQAENQPNGIGQPPDATPPPS